ncbi:MAG: hypothetical protein ACXABO_13090 [Promethearchaeota archaeon]|jgi:DNA-directed RNA polymerase subunit M/transcription elongation factor TFIIS
MRFCTNCENILIPKKNKLFCRACKKEFELDPKTNEYKIVKIIEHEENEFEPIIIRKALKNHRISTEDRKASEEFFQLS